MHFPQYFNTTFKICIALHNSAKYAAFHFCIVTCGKLKIQNMIAKHMFQQVIQTWAGCKDV